MRAASPTLAWWRGSSRRAAMCTANAPSSIDAGIYGFIANIHFYDIDTPLKRCVASHPSLVRHCETLHAAVSS